MRLGLQVVSLVLAVGAMAFALKSHQSPNATAASRWSLRGTVVLCTGMITATVPGMIFPNASGIRIAASLVSLLITATSIVTTRHVYRRLRSTPFQDARR